MKSDEELLRTRLAAIADDIDGPHPAQVSDIHGRARRKRGARRAAAAAVAGTTAGVLVLSLRLFGGDGAPSVAGPEPPSTTAPSQAAPSTTAPPSPGVGTADMEFHVAAPQIANHGGPAPVPQPDCRVSQVAGTGELRPTYDGVAGVVHLVGRHCSLQLHLDGARLVDAHGKPLAVPTRLDDTQPNPPSNPWAYFPLAQGDVRWGFAWRGPWCGPAAAAIEIPIHDPIDRVPRLHDWIHVPLSGSGPTCAAGAQSVLVPGVVATVGQPVLPAPPAWSGLSAQLSAPDREGPRSLTGLTLTLRNDTGSDIHLSPCPAYAITATYAVQNGTSFTANQLPLPCGDGTVVPAHGDRQFRLPAFTYAEGPEDAARPGSTVTLTVAIAGVPTATATVTATS